MKTIDDYKRRLVELCRTEPIALRGFELADKLNLADDYRNLAIAVHALEALAETRKALEDAIAVAPPDAIFVRDENGERKLMRYIGPTIEELRREAGPKKP